MPNVKISAAADAGALLSSDMIPLARSGNTNAYHATMTEIATFTNASIASGAYGNVGRNLCHNPMFNVAQRGAGPFSGFNYTMDRWAIYANLDTASVNQNVVAPGSMVLDEACEYVASISVTGNAGAAAATQFYQPVEDVRRLGNKTVTVSFYAQAGTAGFKLGVSLDQAFGTGGSPSAAVYGNGQAVTLTTSWARYSVTITLPSVAGKTLGTNGNSSTNLNIWLSSGSGSATKAGNIGVQSGAVGLWGVQLEIGSVATPLEKPDPRYDLANCQRFYFPGFASWYGYGAAGGTIGGAVIFPVTMRAVPTVAFISPGYNNASAISFAAGSGLYGQVVATATAAGAAAFTSSYTASADL